jgi:hypothetical protein
MTPSGLFWRVYGTPLLLAMAGCLGVGTGLFGDGFWDWISCLALGGMIGVAVRYALVGRVRRTVVHVPAERHLNRAAQRDTNGKVRLARTTSDNQVTGERQQP